MVDPITADPIMEVIRALSRSRLAIGLITFMGLVITQATRITPGEQVIGGRGMVIGGLVLLFLILAMFLQAITASPRPDSEWESDTDAELPTAPTPADTETPAVVG